MARFVAPTSNPSARTEPAVEGGARAQSPTQATETPDPSARSVNSNLVPPAPVPGTLPSEYRGKSSGEFERVISPQAPDTSGLIAEAERYLEKLPRSDRHRRLLEVAILRRDSALLNGLLEVLRQQTR